MPCVTPDPSDPRDPCDPRCLQNYIPAQSLSLSCPVCRQTSILPERGVPALPNNFFITNLMEVLQRDPDPRGAPPAPLPPLGAATGQPLCCPNHEGKVGRGLGRGWERCSGWGGLRVFGAGCRDLVGLQVSRRAGKLQRADGTQGDWGPAGAGRALVGLGSGEG